MEFQWDQWNIKKKIIISCYFPKKCEDEKCTVQEFLTRMCIKSDVDKLEGKGMERRDGGDSSAETEPHECMKKYGEREAEGEKGGKT